MIITRTPLRISFAGGGSDLPEYYKQAGRGAVLSVTIDKYVYLSMHPYFQENKILLKYSKHELVDNVDMIEHRIIRTVFKDYSISGVDLNSSADVPAGTGLGSSSAFTVGLINLCNAYKNRYMSKEHLAAEACEVEINKLGEPIGKQDQYASAVGGMNYITFCSDETVSVERLLLPKETVDRLHSNLLLFSLGVTRKAGSILSEQKQNTSNDPKVRTNLDTMVRLADELKKELIEGRVDSMGDILHRGWLLKRELAKTISSNQIDYYYDLAIANGASGGKLLGAGGSGFLLLYVNAESQSKVRKALSELKEARFSFENSGSTVIYYDDNW